MPSSSGLDLRSSVMMLVLAAVWGGAFFFGALAVREVPPLTVTLLRVALAVPLLYLIVRAQGLRLPRSARVWGAYLMMGALNNAIPFSLIFYGQTQIDSGLSSILNSTTAMFAAFAAGLLLPDEPLNARKVIGAALGVIGVAVIMGPSALLEFNPTNLAQLAILGASLSYALAGVWGKARLLEHPPLVNALGMVIGSSLLMLPLVLLVDGPPNMALSWSAWGSILGLAALSTVLAYALYFAIMARAGAANVLLVTLLIPVFAIALGVAFLGETMGPEAWIGFAIIALGFAVTDGRPAKALLRRLG